MQTDTNVRSIFLNYQTFRPCGDPRWLCQFSEWSSNDRYWAVGDQAAGDSVHDNVCLQCPYTSSLLLILLSSFSLFLCLPSTFAPLIILSQAHCIGTCEKFTLFRPLKEYSVFVGICPAHTFLIPLLCTVLPVRPESYIYPLFINLNTVHLFICIKFLLDW